MTNLERELDELLRRADIEVEQSQTPLMIACSPELSGPAKEAMDATLREIIRSHGGDEYDYIRTLARKLDRVTVALHNVLVRQNRLVKELAGEALENETICDYCTYSAVNPQDEPCKTCAQSDGDDIGLFAYDFSYAEEDPVDILEET